MMFCPKCGSILRPKTDKGKRVLYCSCGHISKDLQNTQIKERVARSEREIEVAPEDEKTLPLTDAECPKCRHKRAYYWLIQTRAGDEPETKFLKCERCKYTWRDYS